MQTSKFFLTIIFHVARCLPADSSSTPLLKRTFKLQNTTEVNTLIVGASWATTSVASCANSCMQLYPDDCQAFLFKPSEGLCSLVSPPVGTSVLVVADGDLYFSSCDVSKGFQYVVNGSAKACLGIFGPGNYSLAEATCVSKGAHLMSVKTVDRLSLLLEVNARRSVWVGCDDLSQKYTYRWKEDGSVLTNETISQLFIPGDPHYNTGEDCICLNADLGLLGDFTCSYKAYYACELVM